MKWLEDLFGKWPTAAGQPVRTVRDNAEDFVRTVMINLEAPTEDTHPTLEFCQKLWGPGAEFWPYMVNPEWRQYVMDHIDPKYKPRFRPPCSTLGEDWVFRVDRLPTGRPPRHARSLDDPEDL